MWKSIGLSILLLIYSTFSLSNSITEVYLEAKNLVLNAKSNPGNYDLALENVNHLINNNYFLEEAYFLRAKINLAKGDYDQAEADIEKAILLEPDHATYITLFGSVKVYKNQLTDALQLFNKVISMDALSTTAYINRGNVFYIKKDYEKALSDYDEALKLEPFNSAALNNRGRVYYILGEYDKALNDYQLSEKHDTVFTQIPTFFQGLIYEKKGELNSAIDKYTKAIDLSENSQLQFNDPFLARSRVWEKLGEMEKSKSDLKKAESLTTRMYPEID